MRPLLKISFIGALMVGAFFVACAFAEEITVNTYYPSPATSPPNIKSNDAVIGDNAFRSNTPPTNGLIVQGNVGIGTTNPAFRLEVLQPRQSIAYSGYTATTLSGFSAATAPTQLYEAPIYAHSTNPVAADVGGGIGFGGIYQSNSATTWAFIHGKKENATPGNAAGYLQFVTRDNAGNFGERMRITSAGSIGIGTATPQSILDIRRQVDGNLSLLFANNQPPAVGSLNEMVTIQFLHGNTAGGNALKAGGYIRSGKESDYTSDANVDSFLSFATSLNEFDVERMRITSTGDVGIGGNIYTPTDTGQKFIFGGTGMNGPWLELYGRDHTSWKGNAYINFDGIAATGQEFAIIARNAQGLAPGGNLLTVRDTGNVGIGTASPGARLDVDGGASAAIIGTSTSGNGVTGYSTSGYPLAGFGVGSTSGYGVYGRSYGYGVYGLTDGTGPGDKIGVYGAANNPGTFGTVGVKGLGYYGVRGVSSNAYGVWGEGPTGVFGLGGVGVYGEGTGNLPVGVSGTGNATVGGNPTGVGVYGSGNKWDFQAAGGRLSWQSSSIRWKTNIQPLEGALEKTLKLQGVSFDWDAEHGGKHGIGLVGEEVGKVFPELVFYEENGKDAISVNYEKFTAILIEAVKELKAENDALKARIEALEKRQ